MQWICNNLLFSTSDSATMGATCQTGPTMRLVRRQPTRTVANVRTQLLQLERAMSRLIATTTTTPLHTWHSRAQDSTGAHSSDRSHPACASVSTTLVASYACRSHPTSNEDRPPSRGAHFPTDTSHVGDCTQTSAKRHRARRHVHMHSRSYIAKTRSTRARHARHSADRHSDARMESGASRWSDARYHPVLPIPLWWWWWHRLVYLGRYYKTKRPRTMLSMVS